MVTISIYPELIVKGVVILSEMLKVVMTYSPLGLYTYL